MRIADVQDAIRQAVVRGVALPAPLADVIVGGRDPLGRLLLHRRNYVTSLVRALRARFPATEWLVGTDVFLEACTEVVQAAPPRRPCLAEYGDMFADQLAPWCMVSRPWAPDLARLEWQIGRVAVAADPAPLTLARLSSRLEFLDVALEHARWHLVPSLALVAVTWQVESLFACFLADDGTEPDTPDALTGALAVVGSRGVFGIHRVNAGVHALLAALHRGATLAEAIPRAIAADRTFEPGLAMAHLVQQGWIADVTHHPTPSLASAP